MKLSIISRCFTLSIILIITNTYAQKSKWINNNIDFSKIESRIDSFVMKQDNKVKGYWIWKTENKANEIVFTDISVLHNVVEERFKMIFNKKTAVVKYVDLKMNGNGFNLSAKIKRTENTNLKANYNISGNVTRNKTIDTTYNKKVILRPEFFGLLPSISNKKKLDEQLSVYLLSSGFITEMSLKSVGEKKITVPAGEFETYKIELKSTNQISNVIYINKEQPFNIVKVEILGNPLEILLVKSESLDEKIKHPYKLSRENKKLNLKKSIPIDGIHVDADGIIYTAEGWDGSKINRITPSGEVLTFSIGYKGPIDIVENKEGYFYISEWQGSRISKVDKNGKHIKTILTKPGPGPMTIDTVGNIFVTHNVNDGSGFISRISTTDEVTIFSSDAKLVNPGGIDIDEKGNIYIVNFNNANIIRIKPDKSSQILATLPGKNQWRSGHLKVVRDKIYVSDAQENKVYQIDFSGNITILIDDNISKKMKQPVGLSIDQKNHQLFISNGFEKTNYIIKVNLEY